MSQAAKEIHNLIYQLFRSLESSDRDTCACYGVTPLQGLVLLEIAKMKSMNLQELANRMQLAVSTMSRVVDKLVEASFISRQEDENDRRVMQCALTDAGQNTARQLQGCYNDFFDKLVAEIPPGDLAGFLNGLKIMLHQMRGYTGSCGCAANKC